MHVDALGPIVVVATEVVRDATRFMRGADPSAIAYTFTKANGSPVTVADFVVPAFVASRLGQHFPEDPLVAEEDASALRADAQSEVGDWVLRLVRQMLPGAEVDTEQMFAWIDRGQGVCGHRFWTLDPIDGTHGAHERHDQAAGERYGIRIHRRRPWGRIFLPSFRMPGRHVRSRLGEGQSVSFDVGEGPKGPRAENVKGDR